MAVLAKGEYSLTRDALSSLPPNDEPQAAGPQCCMTAAPVDRCAASSSHALPPLSPWHLHKWCTCLQHYCRH